jgi:hypothetical protein
LNPQSGPANTQITVVGNGWRPFSMVTVTYTDGSGQVTDTQTVRAGLHGHFSANIKANESDAVVLPGPRTVSASNSVGESASATFTVTGP